MYISRLQLTNVKCFEELDLSFDLDDGQLPWTMIVGDNASGKTVLLRSIAIGLCDESSAAGLLKESDSGYIRRGKKKAEITLNLRDEKDNTYQIVTTIRQVPTAGGSYERVRQTTEPSKQFPWKQVFACGYGAGRGISGTGDIARYSTLNAVYGLFNYGEGLQNPELTIRRIQERRAVLGVLQDLMVRTDKIALERSGMTADGPWGQKMPVRDLADGYKSSFLWLMDFLGWALDNDPDLQNPADVQGIVLVDEIEQHLHPKWQRVIVHELRSQFPRVQFITTTHSPIVASSVGNMDKATDRDKLIFLKLQDDTTVVKSELKSKKGWRPDQVLASDAFDYLIDSDPEVEELLKEGSILAGKGKERTSKEEKRYTEVKEKIKVLPKGKGSSEIERAIESEDFEAIKQKVEQLEQESENDQD